MSRHPTAILKVRQDARPVGYSVGEASCLETSGKGLPDQAATSVMMGEGLVLQVFPAAGLFAFASLPVAFASLSDLFLCKQ